jgi:hypothetical protein
MDRIIISKMRYINQPRRRRNPPPRPVSGSRFMGEISPRRERPAEGTAYFFAGGSHFTTKTASNAAMSSAGATSTSANIESKGRATPRT